MAYHILAITMEAGSPNPPLLGWATSIDDTTPNFNVDLPKDFEDFRDAKVGDDLVVQYQDEGGDWSSPTEYLTHTLTSEDLEGDPISENAAELEDGQYEFRARLERGSTFSNWSATVDVEIVTEVSATPIAYWKMDEGSGTTMADDVGSLDFTIEDTGTGVWVSPDVGFRFDLGDNAVTGDATALTGLTELTVVAWVKSPPGGENGSALAGVYDFGSPGDRCWVMSQDLAGAPGVRVTLTETGIFAPPAKAKYYHGSLTVFDSALHCVAFRFDSGTLDLFVDGEIDDDVTKERDDSFTTIHASTENTPLGINALYSSGVKVGTAEVNGMVMRGLRVYDVALTDGEILAVFGQGPN